MKSFLENEASTLLILCVLAWGCVRYLESQDQFDLGATVTSSASSTATLRAKGVTGVKLLWPKSWSSVPEQKSKAPGTKTRKQKTKKTPKFCLEICKSIKRDPGRTTKIYNSHKKKMGTNPSIGTFCYWSIIQVDQHPSAALSGARTHTKCRSSPWCRNCPKVVYSFFLQELVIAWNFYHVWV